MFSALKNRLYDSSKIDSDNKLFSNKALWVLLFPIIIEQLLNSFMGMADTMMVSNVGSSAISAVSLVDSINVLVIQVFSAMATGATIICSQFLGRGDERRTNKAARQVVLTMVVISVTLTILLISCRSWLLSFIFGQVESEVMADAKVYFLITVLSYPFIALFNAGSAFYRAGGNSKFPMKIAVVSNLLNIIGNIILIFGFHMGVAGAALSTLISRIFCCMVVFYFLGKPKQPIVLNEYLKIRPDFPLIGMILSVGVPAGIENGMFQFGKLAIQSTVSTLGTAAIAAQAMTNILETVNGIAAIGIGIGLMTIVGQCMGAGRKEEAKYYIVKLTGYAEVAIILSCLFAMAITKPITYLAGMEAESAKLCFEMMIAITIVKPFVWVLSFIPAYGMRAAGDVKFSMIVSTLTMWLCRVALCVYLCKVWGFGPIAVWIGMFADWTIRGIIFSTRFFSGKWAEKQVI
ncbi:MULTISPECIES: MATE family efflux transporter [Cellulosilyticum]|uniref:Probable multidrug resistance protein NorM n=1 Tax=Cellulosilyticum lentocellum (strain ATCC 49066 / DSM 5427 / NCIMB 11756 / RHM5) TaxID=642492 RepID=F2JQH5_CELLD|nr:MULTISPECIES: MATE family efflux transporter [Cellulosilyticum]ADZ84959.1 MATE efflux family protein [Cellulosilyticum lentocellum DSM 5427]QEH70417.1 MATE family efflux transporter [Cellulosilyticum sp. WCF-2]